MQSTTQTSLPRKSWLQQLYAKRWQLTLATSLGLTLWSASIATPAPAITVQAVPNPRQVNRWISDTQDLITPQSEATLNQQLTALEAQTGTEMTIVTVDDTAGSASPKAFATKLFNTWGVGKADQDNGVLFLVSVGDRRSEVEVGYGLESVLTTSEIENLLEKDAVPHFKQGDFDRGIVLATQSMIEQLDPAGVSPNPVSAPLSGDNPDNNSENNAGSTSDNTSPVTPAVGINALNEQPLIIKILTIGSGAIAFVFARFGTALLIAPKALTPGTQQRFSLIDFEAISQTISFALIGFVSLFGLGAIAFGLTGLGAPLLGGTILGLVGALGFTAKKSAEKGVSPFRCEDCGVSLNKIDSSALHAHLSKPQRVASDLGSAAYIGWQCPDCEGVITRCTYPWSRYKDCLRCKEPTVSKSSSVTTRPTYHYSGEKRVTETCHCCDYSSSHTVTLPRLERSSASSSGGYISGSSGGFSGGSSGGSFGGGSSGGGGGGGADW